MKVKISTLISDILRYIGRLIQITIEHIIIKKAITILIDASVVNLYCSLDKLSLFLQIDPLQMIVIQAARIVPRTKIILIV